MNVGSYLEIYTTMFGWSVYNTLYDLFNVTGLLYLPFLMLIYKNWRDPYLSQDDKPAAVTSQRRMTWGVLSLMIVFSLAVLPFKPLALNQVQYKVACTDGVTGNTMTPVNVAGGNTGTTYDTAALGGSSARIPIIWWLVLSISSGIDYALTQSFTCFEDINGLDRQLRSLTIKDPAIRQEYYRYANECFLPAKSKFKQSMKGGEYHTYVTAALASWLGSNSDYDASDPYFIGSHFYLDTDGFYKGFNKAADCTALIGGCGFQAKESVPGWPYVAARDNYSQADITAGKPGRPFCDEWWTDSARGLEKKLLANIEPSKLTIQNTGWDTTQTFFTNMSNMITSLFTASYTVDQMEDIAIKSFVSQDPPEMLGGSASSPGNGSLAGLATSGVGGLGAGALIATFPAVAMATSAVAVASTGALVSTGSGIVKEFAGFYTMMFVIKKAAPMLQAVLLMMIYIMLLVYLVVSEYEVDSVITAIFLLLAIRFFTPLWAIADYLDDRLFLAMYPDASWLGSGITLSLQRVLLEMVLTILYVIAPMLLLYLMQMAGQNISRIGQSGMEGPGGHVGGVGKGVGKSGRIR